MPSIPEFNSAERVRARKALGALLRALRLDAGYSLLDVSEKLGMTYQQLQKYETGANRLSIQVFLDIHKVYRACPVSTLQTFLKIKTNQNLKGDPKCRVLKSQIMMAVDHIKDQKTLEGLAIIMRQLILRRVIK